MSPTPHHGTGSCPPRAIRLKVGGYLTRSSRYVLFMDDEGEIMLTKDYPWTDQ